MITQRKSNKECFPSPPFSRRKLCLAVAAATQLLVAGRAYAGPEGGQVVGGLGSIDQTGTRTTIEQQTDRLAIDWANFDVAADEQVRFVQPSSSSIALNRVLSHKGSEIHGRIDANGHVWLVNPNGVFFGEGSQVNVGGVLASGLSVDPRDFMNDDFTFSAVDGGQGTVVNAGIINAATGGSVGLIGEQVRNEGLIAANLGAVNLAAGREAVVSFDADGLMGVRISEAVLQEDIGVDAAIVNSGGISAHGGRILLTASVSQDIFSGAVNRGEMDQAKSVVVHQDGSFTLGAGADVVNTGNLDVSAESGAGDVVILGENVTSSGAVNADAEDGEGGHIELHATDTTLFTGSAMTSARSDGGKGGTIKLLGNKVGLFDTAAVDASGLSGGGQVFIGGGESGQDERIRNANFIYLGEDTTVEANGVLNGDGGRVIAFASDAARIYGTIAAKGGSESGNGGFVETSGLQYLQVLGSPDVSADAGIGGTWLIDPYDLTIRNSGNASIDEEDGIFVSGYGDSVLRVDDIEAALENGDVIVRTGNGGTGSGKITFEDSLVLSVYPGTVVSTLTLEAHNGIDLGGNLIGADSKRNELLNIELDAGAGSIVLGDGGGINTNGGYLTVRRSTNLNGMGGTISTIPGEYAIVDDPGDVIINTTGYVALGELNSHNLTIEAGGPITQSDSINVSGDANLSTENGNITLSHSGNTFGGTISLATPGSATLHDSDGNGITLGATNVGALNLSSAGAILQANQQDLAGALNVTGTTSLSAAGRIELGNVHNDFGDLITVTSTVESLELYDLNDLHIGAVTTDGGSIYLGGNGTIALHGDLIARDGLERWDITVDGDVELAATTSITGHDVLLAGSMQDDAADPQRDLVIDANSVTVQGAAGSETSRLGTVQLTAAGDVHFGTEETRSDIWATSLEVDAANFTAGDIRATGLPQLATDDGNGNITITLPDVVDINVGTGAITTGSIDTSGDDVSNGGNILLSGGRISVAGLTSDALQSHADALAGDITIDGSESVIIGGDVSALNGDSSQKAAVVNLLGRESTFEFAGSDFLGGQITVNGDGDDKVIVSSSASHWLINGDTGNITDLDGSTAGQIVYSGISSLTGSTAGDKFQINSLFTGSIDGAGGIDALDVSALSDAVVELGGDSAAHVNVIGVKQLQGNGTDSTLLIASGNNIWEIGDIGGDANSSNEGSVRAGDGDPFPGAVEFDGFANLIGGAGDDTFIFDGANGSITGSVDGGLGRNTIEGPVADVIWKITGQNQGSVHGAPEEIHTYLAAFTNVQHLKGSTGRDIFSFTSLDAAIDSADGGAAGGINSVDLSQLTGLDANNLFQLTLSDGGIFGISNISQVNGNSSVADYLTLAVYGGNNTWWLSGDNSGSVALSGSDPDSAIQFLDFGNLQGGTDSDSFVVEGGSLSGTLNGGDGSDSLTVATEAGNITVAAGPTHSVGHLNVHGVETLTGNNLDTTLLATGGDNRWAINGSNAGTLEIGSSSPIDFSGFVNLTGGSGEDIFTVGGSGSLAGEIRGEGGENYLIGPDAGALWRLNGTQTGSLWTADGAQAIVASFSGIQHLMGGAGDDTFSYDHQQAQVSSLDGGLGENIVDLSRMAGLSDLDRFTLTLGGSANAGVTNIDRVIGRSDEFAEHIILAVDAATESVWRFLDFDSAGTDADGLNDGTVQLGSSVTEFVNFKRIAGSDGADSFTLEQGGSYTGLIDGGQGDDRLAIASDAASTIAVDSSQSEHLNVRNIETLSGNGLNTTVLVDSGANTWTIGGVDSGSVETSTSLVSFLAMTNLSGGSGNDAFILEAGGSIAGLIDGGEPASGDDQDTLTIASNDLTTVELGAQVTENLNVDKVERIVGNGNSTTLLVSGGNNTWTIGDFDGDPSSNVISDGANDGTVLATASPAFHGEVQFVNVANLTGGSGDDTFIVNEYGDLTGVVDGGGSDNDIFRIATSRAVAVQLGSVPRSGYITASNFEQVFGNSANSTLSVANGENIWTLEDASGGAVVTAGDAFDGSVHFSGFATLQGGGDEDTLIGANQHNNWSISGDGEGSVGALEFTGFENLTGNASRDDFTFLQAGRLAGWIDGGSNSDGSIPDTLDLTSFLDGVSVQLGNSSPSDAPSGIPSVRVTGVERITAAAADAGNTDRENFNFLTGADQNSGWEITGTNDGRVSPNGGSSAVVQFYNFGRLRGGSGDDRFAVIGDITGSIDGGNGQDLVDYSALAGDITITLGDSGVIALDDNIKSIEGVVGNNDGLDNTDYDSRIVAGNGDNGWIFGSFDSLSDGLNDVQLTTSDGTVVRFENFNVISGGNGDDVFTFNQVAGKDARFHGAINGGGGNDSFSAAGSDYDQDIRLLGEAYGGSSTTTLAHPATYIFGLEAVTANPNANNTLSGLAAADNDWAIDSNGNGVLNGMVFSGFARLIGGSGNDTFDIDNATGLTHIDGGTPASGVTDVVDLADVAADLVVGLGITASADLRLANIDEVLGNASANNTLVADNAGDNNWVITGGNQGTVNTVSFSGFRNLTGRDHSDIFLFEPTGAVNGLIDGGAGSNRVDLSGTVESYDVGLGVVAGADLNLLNMAEVIGNDNADSRLSLASGSNVWTIDGADRGEVNGVIFSRFANLRGGSGADSFVLQGSGAGVSGSIDGGSGHNSLRGRNETTQWYLTAQHAGYLANSAGTYLRFTAIQELLGNSGNDSLTGINQNNTWLVKGAGAGSVAATGSPGSSISFSGMENLWGNDELDHFTFENGSITGNLYGAGGDDTFILSSGSVLGTVSGGSGNDHLVIMVNAGAAGHLDVDGGSDSDTIAVSGGAAGYRAEHGLATAGGGVLRYTTGTATYTIGYSSFSEIADTLLADSLAINGTSAADSFVFGNNRYALNGFSSISFANKKDLLIAGGAGDTIALNGRTEVDGDLSIRGAVVSAGDSGSIAANRLFLDGTASVGSADKRLKTDVAELSLINGNGAVYLQEQTGLNIIDFETSSDFDVQLSSGNLTSDLALTSSKRFAAQAFNGNLVLTRQNALSGDLNLVASGSLEFTNTTSTRLTGLRAGTLDLDSRGNINGVGPIEVSGLASFNSDGDIVLTNAANDFDRIAVLGADQLSIIDKNELSVDEVTASGSVKIDTRNDLMLDGAVRGAAGIDLSATHGSITQNSTLDAGQGDITVTASGDITMGRNASSLASGRIRYQSNNIALGSLQADLLELLASGAVADSNGGALNANARSLVINAETGVAAGDFLETRVSFLSLSNNLGSANITNNGPLTVTGLRSNGDISLINTSGDVYLDNSDGALYSRDATDARNAGGTSDANYNIGTLLIDLADGDLLATAPANIEDPIISARNASLVARRGGIGHPARPLVVHVQDNLVLVSALPSWIRFAFEQEPASVDDTQSLSGDVIDLITSGNEQLVEIEGLEDIDPAVFTNVRNYSYGDISIRLPPDQLYEDDEENF